MKKALLSARLCRFAASAAFCLMTNLTRAQSIPEPGLLVYGQVRNIATGGNLLTYGILHWTIQPPTGSPITVGVTLTNINDQFSYILRVPFESALAGFTISPNTLSLSNTPVTYARSATVNVQPATILSPALPNFTFGAADRGRSERVDLEVALAIVDSVGDGIPDGWRQQYFGGTGTTTNSVSCAACDPDQDGMSNYAEYRAGTDPNDPQSRFAFLDVEPDPLGGIALRWSSVALHKYSLLRSGDLLAPFSNLQTNLDATPGTNYVRDATATNAGPYFYRLKVE